MRTVLTLLVFFAALSLAADVAPCCATGTVTASVKSYYIVDTGSNRIEILKGRCPGLKAGDIIVLPDERHLSPYRTDPENLPRIRIIGHTTLPTPPLSDLQEIDSVRTNRQRVRIRGWVKDAACDPLDEDWMRLVLKSGRETIDVAVPIPPDQTFQPSAFKFATIEVVGLCRRMIQGGRLFATASIEVSDPRDVTVLAKPSDPFEQPSLDCLAGMSATEILAANACTASGVVAAVWGRRFFLLRTTSRTDQLVRVDLNGSVDLPRYGDSVEAVGIVQTDLHHIRLTDALCRPASDPTNPQPPVAETSCVLSGNNNDVYLHGRTTSVTGKVTEAVTQGANAGQLRLAVGNLTLNADISSLDRIPDGFDVGSTIAMTAVCIAETDAWRPGENLANYHGMTLVPRTADDILVLARPPWWTAGRLLAVILALVAILIGIAVWNRILMKLANRRGHELFRSEYARASAVLRVGERTRLATELHDSLSQSLSGIACQVAAATHAIDTDPAGAKGRLTAAENMLASCRNELGNCLFDLRGDMLEEPDFSTAIRKSLALVSGAAEHATVRMNIPRSRLHDATAHAVLCMVRELVSNALRHGKAEHVRVAGCIDGDLMLFSVTDDGSGFDPASRPGPATGHFGLTGIGDRVRRFKGSLLIEAVQPHGTRVAVSLPVPKDVSQTKD